MNTHEGNRLFNVLSCLRDLVLVPNGLNFTDFRNAH